MVADPEDRQRRIDSARSLGAIWTLGWSVVIAVVLGAWLGWLLDRWLGTSPWLFLLFFFLGLVAAMLNVFRAGKSMK